MRILTSSHYTAGFTVPSHASHLVERIWFPNLGRLWSPTFPIAVYSPGKSYDVVHCINKIPVALGKPWVITFESTLPCIYPPSGQLREFLRRQFCQPNCLGIIAMSSWAHENFKRNNSDWSDLGNALEKTRVLHPAIPIADPTPLRLRAGETIRVVFVGNNFARKGGIVALRLAKKALAENFPLEVNIVSSKMIYSGSHTDHPDPQVYQDDLRNLSLPNVIFHGSLNNQQVLDLMRKCHMNLLPTLFDTYGFSVIEGFANGLPAITSNICALPEFVLSELGEDSNGFLLKLPKDERGYWTHIGNSTSPDYWEMLDEAFESMANQALVHLQNLAAAPELLGQLSRASIASIERRHNPVRLAETLGAIYSN
jgi:glycosyltransferase involved in cell wall biosynthesis